MDWTVVCCLEAIGVDGRFLVDVVVGRLCFLRIGCSSTGRQNLAMTGRGVFLLCILSSGVLKRQRTMRQSRPPPLQRTMCLFPREKLSQNLMNTAPRNRDPRVSTSRS